MPSALTSSSSRVGLADGAQQGVLGQRGHLVKAAAHAHAQHDGGTGVGAGQTHRLHHEAHHALHPVGGLEHGKAAHILAAEALGHHGDGTAVAGHQPKGDGGGGVVPGVHPAQGVGHDGFAQIALAIAPAHSLVDSLLEVALDMYLLAQLHKDAGHARVLTDGQLSGAGQLHVVPQQAQLGDGGGGNDFHGRSDSFPAVGDRGEGVFSAEPGGVEKNTSRWTGEGES